MTTFSIAFYEYHLSTTGLVYAGEQIEECNILLCSFMNLLIKSIVGA